ncbi:MAG: phosphogluconate dehydratase [Hyphomonadaceae bacterium]|nr:phosphogluconate dehydratase [Hyphomonadaceae bacterium]
MNPKLQQITDRIIERSKESRKDYLQLTKSNRMDGPARAGLSAGNQAHAYAGCALQDKKALMGASWPNIGIVTSYNDMLSAHAPYASYPELIKQAAREVSATAQVAGGVPAMCDGVTQGKDGMEMSLFSRDVIAMGTAISLSHNTYDAGLFLGICDKIVPGLLIGALQFGHLPAIFVPAGPMPSGLPNKEKIRIRQLYAEGKIGRDELLKAETESYHSPGTCTFYGTANSNQMLMEIMGLHLPGAAFINPGTPLRTALTKAATHRAKQISTFGDEYIPIAEIVSEKAIVNAIVGLMATGGSTNHALHIPAIAAAAGIIVNWDDFDEISKITPLLTKIYPNGQADVNHFQAAGGMGVLIQELLSAGLLHDDVTTVMGQGLRNHTQEPVLEDEKAVWRPCPEKGLDDNVLTTVSKPFREDGGLAVLKGQLGRGVIKVSAVKREHHLVKAPAVVFNSQDEMIEAFKNGDLDHDFVAVVRFQGPGANGMPELHKLTPPLGVLQDKGFKVALVTDGRMSGASGKVPAAIHMVPEAAKGGPLSKIRTGDLITLNATTGELSVELLEGGLFESRPSEAFKPNQKLLGFGRDLFDVFRASCSSAEHGGASFQSSGGS